MTSDLFASLAQEDLVDHPLMRDSLGYAQCATCKQYNILPEETGPDCWYCRWEARQKAEVARHKREQEWHGEGWREWHPLSSGSVDFTPEKMMELQQPYSHPFRYE